MPSSELTYSEVKNYLESPSSIANRAFVIMQGLCALANKRGNESEVQELVLRALEHRSLFGSSAQILDAIARDFGLFPYLDVDNLGLADRIAYECHRPDDFGNGQFVFHRGQAKVYYALLSGQNVVLSAPTSFGKSLIIDALVATRKYSNILVIVPTIALIDETRKRLNAFHSEYNIITHSFQSPGEKNVFVLTQERALQRRDLEGVDLFVIDEFYKLALDRDDSSRAVLLNQIFYRMSKKDKQFYMLGPSIHGIPEELNQRCTFLKEDYKTVVTEYHRIDSKGNEFAALVSLCREIEGPTIIFVRSPERAAIVARELMRQEFFRESGQNQDAVNWIGREYHPDWHFVEALSRGIGVHHGRIPRALAQFVVKAFNSDQINFLICTSTLIEGVNTKARNIIVFDSTIGNRRYDFFTYNNIAGRAGRMFRHFVGHVYLFHEPPSDELPDIDVPVLTQTTGTPTSLLVQIDIEDLEVRSWDEIDSILAQNVLSLETIKSINGLDPQSLINLAQDILDRFDELLPLLQWDSRPSWEQLMLICQLIWDHFSGAELGNHSARHPRHLATRIKLLERRHSIAYLIADQEKFSATVDVAVANVLDFLRLWANFHFPKFLRAIDAVQKDLLSQEGLKTGDYEHYASAVENYFQHPHLVALDEYGIPLQLALKLEGYLLSVEDFDLMLRRLGLLDLSRIKLMPFESELLADFQLYV